MLLFLLFLKLSRWKHRMTAPFWFFYAMLLNSSVYFFFYNFLTKFHILSFPFAEFVSVKRDKNSLIYATDSHQIQTQVWKCLPKTNANRYLGISQTPKRWAVNNKQVPLVQMGGLVSADSHSYWGQVTTCLTENTIATIQSDPAGSDPAGSDCYWKLCHQNVHMLFTAWIDCCMIFPKFPQNALFGVKARCFQQLITHLSPKGQTETTLAEQKDILLLA